MFEPHLDGFHDPTSDPKSFDSADSGKVDLLAELDRIAPIKSFDAFPKVSPGDVRISLHEVCVGAPKPEGGPGDKVDCLWVQATYTSRSRRGGIVTAVVSAIIFLLILNDLGEYFLPLPTYTFEVDPSISHKTLQLNVDMTIGMPCHFLTIDLRDVLGDRLHLSDDFQKDGTTFETGKASSSAPPAPTTPSASKVIHDARRSLPSPKNRRSASSGLRSLFGLRRSPASRSVNHKQIAAYRPTTNKIDNGPACRIYGSVDVKKVMANMHITTLGHGYMSWEHTGHDMMNLSHIIHEFSFGPYFPAIAQPLDMSYAITEAPFAVFQYFLSVVPTVYIDSRRRQIRTHQYAVTDYSRTIEHGKGVPGIFFKFDIEPLSMRIEERGGSLYHLLIRLIGVIGGVWTTASFALRVLSRAEREVKQKVLHQKGRSGVDDDGSGGGLIGIIPTSVGPSPVGTPSGSVLRGNGYGDGTGMSRKGSWLSGGGT